MSLGSDGEDIAVTFLERLKYRIISRNYHSRFGEIDIIAQDPSAGSLRTSGQAGEAVLVFVEVKTRSNASYGTPLEAITRSKLSKLIKTSQFFISQNKLGDVDFRFDAIEILFERGEPKITHLKSVTI